MVIENNDLPIPVGYRILLELPETEEKTKGGIILPDETRDREEAASVAMKVVAMGPECYADPEKFKTKWCNVGDYVLTGAYKGVRFRVKGKEYRMVNDDAIQAVVADTKEFSRV